MVARMVLVSDRPPPPALPFIGTFKLVESSEDRGDCAVLGESDDTEEIARELNLTGQEICFKSGRLQYMDNSSKNVVFVMPMTVAKGKDAFVKFINAMSDRADENRRKEGIVVPPVSQGMHRLENHELFWYSDEYTVLMTQEAKATVRPDGVSYSYGIATGDNAVTAYFFELYPPLK